MNRHVSSGMLAALLAIASSAQISAATPPFPQCPATGASKSCRILITINADGSIAIDTDTTVAPIDVANIPRGNIAEDALIGVQNNSGVPVDSIILTGSGDESTQFNGIFHFDLNQPQSETTLICVPKSTANCVTGYEGPGVSFTNISTDFRLGTVVFDPPIKPAKSAYFALENDGLSEAVNVSALSFVVVTNGAGSNRLLGFGSPNPLGFSATVKINTPQGNWLTFNASPFSPGSTTFSATTPASVNVVVNPTGLAPGVYSNAAVVTVTPMSNQQPVPPSPITIPVSLTVLPQLSITAPCPAAPGVTGLPYSFTVSASGGLQPYTWVLASGPVPSGLLINPSTGVISGTPTRAGAFPVMITVLDSGTGAAQQSRTYSCTIVIGAGVMITTTTLPSGTAGAPYSAPLAASGGTPPYSNWTTTGSLPPGLALNSTTGVISGTPATATGSPFNFSVTVRDSQGNTSPAAALSIAIAPQASGPAPSVAVVNGGNTMLISPGSIGFVYGANLGPQASVLIDGVQNQVLFSRPDFLVFQISARLPSEVKASLIVQRGGLSSTPFPITLNTFSPNIFSIGFEPNNYFQTSPGVIASRANPVSSGDRVFFYATGLGTAIPPPRPELAVDGQPVPIVSISTLPLSIGDPSATPVQLPIFYFDIPASLKAGTHSVTIQVGGFTSNIAPLQLISAGIILSQTGLTFQAVVGQPAPPSKNFAVLSGSGTLNFSIATSTLPDGLGWLSASPLSGTAQAGQPGVPVQVQTNPAALSPGTYFGLVQVSSASAVNSPQILVAVLNVLPAGVNPGPELSKTGLIFTRAPGGSDPAPQSISVTNLAAEPMAFAASIVAGSAANPFSVLAAPGNLAPGQAAIATVKASTAGLAAGVYTGILRISFSDGTTKNVGLVLVVAAGASSSGGSASAEVSPTSYAPAANVACSPTKLVPLFTQLENGFNRVAGFPTPIEVNIVDDCTSPMTSGTVSVSFSNGDPVLYLTSQHNGSWTATWAAVNPRPAGITATVQAQQQETQLQGTVQVTGGIQPNPNVPVVSRGGVVEAASYSAQPAPGSLVSIFGAKLSAGSGGATQLPLSTLLLSTKVLVAGRELPLVFTSDGQVNAVLPYDLPVDAKVQLFVRNANSTSIGEYFSLASARPAVFTLDNSGTGQGHIYKPDTAGNQVLAGSASPAKSGDVLVVYCSGLGAVDPPVTAGTGASFTVLSRTVNPVTVKIGGRAVTPAFAGLTPGFTGLYQVNVVVPDGLADNDATQFVLSAAGQDSAAVTIAVRQ